MVKLKDRKKRKKEWMKYNQMESYQSIAQIILILEEAQVMYS
jgi:hypothetical protein